MFNVDALNTEPESGHRFARGQMVTIISGPWVGTTARVAGHERDLQNRPAYRLNIDGQETTANEHELAPA